MKAISKFYLNILCGQGLPFFVYLYRETKDELSHLIFRTTCCRKQVLPAATQQSKLSDLCWFAGKCELYNSCNTASFHIGRPENTKAPFCAEFVNCASAYGGLDLSNKNSRYCLWIIDTVSCLKKNVGETSFKLVLNSNNDTGYPGQAKTALSTIISLC